MSRRRGAHLIFLPPGGPNLTSTRASTSSAPRARQLRGRQNRSDFASAEEKEAAAEQLRFEDPSSDESDATVDCRSTVSSLTSDESEDGSLDQKLGYTGKKSASAPYISNRASKVHGKTYAEALKVRYTNRAGKLVQYKKADLEYDMRNGYLAVSNMQ